MNKKLLAMMSKRNELKTQAQGLLDTAQKEERPLTDAEKETLESMLANSHSGFIHALDKAYAGVSISISYASMTTNIEYDFTTFKLEEGVIITIPCTYRG